MDPVDFDEKLWHLIQTKLEVKVKTFINIYDVEKLLDGFGLKADVATRDVDTGQAVMHSIDHDAFQTYKERLYEDADDNEDLPIITTYSDATFVKGNVDIDKESTQEQDIQDLPLLGDIDKESIQEQDIQDLIDEYEKYGAYFDCVLNKSLDDPCRRSKAFIEYMIEQSLKMKRMV